MAEKPKPDAQTEAPASNPDPLDSQGSPWEQTTSDRTDKAYFGAYKPQEFAACLVMLSGTEVSSVGKSFPLSKSVTILGRSSKCDITVDDPAASRKHAEITREDDKYVLRDLKSSNGSFVNGARIVEEVLERGDRVQLGSDSTIFKFTIQDKLEQRFHESLYDGSYRDALTAAFNKRYFTERLASEFSFSVRHRRPLSLMLLDLDDFKRINDEYGHLAGDDVLRDVAANIEKGLRTEDVFARIGGEEFGVLLRDTGLESTQVVADRVLAQIRSGRTRHRDIQLKVTASIGLACFQNGLPSTAEALVARADACLYEAKTSGKDRICK